jgi:broad specificity phosphatase PhoE
MNFANVCLDLFLIRHAQPENPENHWTSPISPLSEEGIKQAKLTGQALKKQNFTELLVSPFLRAKQTAEYINKEFKNQVPLSEQQWLAEIDLGVWAGEDKSKIQIDPNYPPFFPKDKIKGESLVARLLNTNKSFAFPEGESLQVFWNRVSNGFKGLLDGYRDGKERTLGLIGHGGSFTIIQSVLLGKTFGDDNFPVIAIQMGNFIHLRIYKGRMVIIKVT